MCMRRWVFFVLFFEIYMVQKKFQLWISCIGLVMGVHLGVRIIETEREKSVNQRLTSPFISLMMRRHLGPQGEHKAASCFSKALYLQCTHRSSFRPCLAYLLKINIHLALPSLLLNSFFWLEFITGKKQGILRAISTEIFYIWMVKWFFSKWGKALNTAILLSLLGVGMHCGARWVGVNVQAVTHHHFPQQQHCSVTKFLRQVSRQKKWFIHFTLALGFARWLWQIAMKCS